jgi:hypothetical protein
MQTRHRDEAFKKGAGALSLYTAAELVGEEEDPLLR